MMKETKWRGWRNQICGRGWGGKENGSLCRRKDSAHKIEIEVTGSDRSSSGKSIKVQGCKWV